MRTFRCIIAGTPSTSVAVAQAILDSGNFVAGVLCPHPKPVGRKKIVTPSALEQWAIEHSIPAFHVNRETLRDETGFRAQLTNKLQDTPDLLISADFGYLIPAWLLEYPRLIALNIHPSDLPRWRGATPVPFTLLHGEQETKITIIEMSPAFDTGNILLQLPFSIGMMETADQVLLNAFAIAGTSIAQLVDQIDHKSAKPIPQPKESPTPYARKFTKDDGFVPFTCVQTLFLPNGDQRDDQTAGVITNDADRPPLQVEYQIPTTALSIHNMIRALSPWPGVWTTLPNTNNSRLILQSSRYQEKTNTVQLVTGKLEGKTDQSFGKIMQSVHLEQL